MMGISFNKPPPASGTLVLRYEAANHLSEVPRYLVGFACTAICHGLDVTYVLSPRAEAKTLGERARIIPSVGSADA
ncbi:hypothetical protein [Azospirillum argentinense]